MSEYKFKTCQEACKRLETSCPNEDCRNWINYEEDLNCCLISVEKHGNMTLDEISKRIGHSLVWVQQIEQKALKKVKNIMEAQKNGFV